MESPSKKTFFESFTIGAVSGTLSSLILQPLGKKCFVLLIACPIIMKIRRKDFYFALFCVFCLAPTETPLAIVQYLSHISVANQHLIYHILLKKTRITTLSTSTS